MDEPKQPTELFVYVHVERLDGKKERLKLPKDLQEPMRAYIDEHPHNWKELLKGGLTISLPRLIAKRVSHL